MGKFYQKFLALNLDLAPLGMERVDHSTAYFCTPRGASIIGWAGVDGIHYCFIRGFGEMVFSVSPMNGYPDYVHPLAENFEDFLRLLLAGKDANYLEQAWMLTPDRFEQFVQDYTPTQEAQTVLSQLADRMHLEPMETPWQYMKNLRDAFDYSKIKYTEEFYDPEMNENVPPQEWAVYYDGSIYGHSGSGKAGIEIPVKKEFQYAGRIFLVPAVYSCAKGLVMDICMQVDPEEYQRFDAKWSETCFAAEDAPMSQREQMQMELENPLNLDFCPEVRVNGQRLKWRGSRSYFIPSDDLVEQDVDTIQMLEHYHLDRSFAWSFVRARFPWATGRRPEIKTLELTMVQRPVTIPGDVFHVDGPGDRVEIIAPGGGEVYALTVREYEQQTLNPEDLSRDNMEFPTRYTLMRYTLSPELPGFSVKDLSTCDQPRLRQTSAAENTSCCCAAAIGVIGGADGPTAVCLAAPQKEHMHSACSSLHFELPERIGWYPVFQVAGQEALTITIL